MHGEGELSLQHNPHKSAPLNIHQCRPLHYLLNYNEEMLTLSSSLNKRLVFPKTGDHHRHHQYK